MDPPTQGNAGFGVDLAGATPSCTALLLASLSQAVAPPPCTPLVGLGPGNLVLPAGALGVVRSDASGAGRVSIPLPADPGLRGATLFLQWAVADPLGASASPLPGFAFSRGRTIILW